MLNNSKARVEFVNKINNNLNKLYMLNNKLTKNIEKMENISKNTEKTVLIKKILEIMKEIRSEYDVAESLLPNAFEPFPTYNDILF